MSNFEYKGFRIGTRRQGVWVADIRPPQSGFAFVEMPTATIDEGEMVCLGRAREVVDAFIAAQVTKNAGRA